jgi:hypothetical protein
MTDTSREAVEMRAQQHDGTSAIMPGVLGAWCRETADLLRALLAERDAAIAARDEAIRMMGEASRQAGSWQGISEGKDLAIKQLEADRDYWMQNSATAWDTCEQRRLEAAQASLERDALRAALRSASLDRLAANDAPLLDAEAAFAAGAEAMRRAAEDACQAAFQPAPAMDAAAVNAVRAGVALCVATIRALPLPKMEDNND